MAKWTTIAFFAALCYSPNYTLFPFTAKYKLQLILLP